MTRKFLRTGTLRFKRLGRNRKKKQRWRMPKGRHSKVREKRKGRSRKVEIGYKKEKGKVQQIIKNIKQAEKINKGDLVIIGSIGKKKRIEIEKRIKEKGGEIINKRK